MPAKSFPTTFPNQGDGYAIASSGSWPPSAGAASFYLNTTTEIVRRSLVGGVYYVSVAMLRFDTSAIPDDATIESAKLRLFIDDVTISGSDNRSLVVEWYAYGTNMDAADWTSTAASTAHAGTVLSQLATVEGDYVELELQNLASILPASVTGVRIHISGGVPAGENYIRFRAANYPSSPTANQWTFFHSGHYSTPKYGAYQAELVVTWGEPGQTSGTTPPGGEGSGSVDPELPGGGISASTVLPRAEVSWRVVLCDRAGLELQSLTTIATEKQLVYRLNRPSSFVFTVPSNHPSVAGLHTDGNPFLHGLRVVKAYRREVLADGTELYVLRFIGEVWQIGDAGDAQTAGTRVSCFDFFQRLSHRFTGPLRKFTAENGAIVARKLVDEANQKSPTGVITEGGTFETTPVRTLELTRANVGATLVALASAYNGFDLEFKPIDDDPGIFMRFSAFARLGQYQPTISFGWGIAPHNVETMTRTQNAETIANEVTGIGASSTFTTRNQAAVDAIGLLEDVEGYTDVTNTAFLQALVEEEIGFRLRSREIVTFAPTTGGWEPFTHIHVGDTFPVFAGARLRGGFGGIVRCYGFDIDLDDNGIERVSSFVAVPE